MISLPDSGPWKRIERIGNAVLLLGDCLEILPHLPKVDAVITSPPYAKQRDYASVSAEQYPAWGSAVILACLSNARNVFLNIKEHAENGARHTYVYKTILRAVMDGAVLVDEFIWVKTNPFPIGGNTRLKDGFERIFHFSLGDSQIFPEQVQEKSKSVWANDNFRRSNKGAFDTTNGSGMKMSRRIESEDVRPSNVITFPSECRSTEHPAVFPIELPSFFIRLSTRANQSVLDPFMGSGTTGVACMNLGRSFIGIEIEPKYFDIACERIENAQRQERLFA